MLRQKYAQALQIIDYDLIMYTLARKLTEQKLIPLTNVFC